MITTVYAPGDLRYQAIKNAANIHYLKLVQMKKNYTFNRWEITVEVDDKCVSQMFVFGKKIGLELSKI